MRGTRPGGAAWARMALAALTVASALVGPWYARETLSSVTRQIFQTAPAAQTNLALSGSGPLLEEKDLHGKVPEDVSRWFGTPIGSTQISVVELKGQKGAGFGHLVWRDQACKHLELRSGSCPQKATDVIAEESLASANGWRIGSTAIISEISGTWSTPDKAPQLQVTIVGTYAARPDPAYWLATPLTTAADANVTTSLIGALLTVPETFTADWLTGTGEPAPFATRRVGLDYPMAPSTGEFDASRVAGPAVASFLKQILSGPPDGGGFTESISTASGLPTLVAQVEAARRQVLLTVPVIAAGLTAIVGGVFWLAVMAAASALRPYAAISRLRGHGRAGAQRIILRRILPAVLIGLPVGVLLAGALAWAAKTWWFTPTPEVQLDLPTLAVGLAAVCVPVLLTAIAARRVGTEQVPTLLRSVPMRRSGQRVTALEAIVATIAVGGFALVVTGDLQGPAALIAPMLLALAAGVAGARVAMRFGARRGRTLMAQGRVTTGLGLLRMSRHGLPRFVIPVTSMAVSLLVFSIAASAMATREYSRQAKADVGALAVLDVQAVRPDLFAAAVAKADPGAALATPVVRVVADQPKAVPVLAVDAATFPKIAFADPAIPAKAWADLRPGPVAPVMFAGKILSGRFKAPALPPPNTLSLQLDYRRPDWRPVRVALAATNNDKQDGTSFSVPVECAEGCRLIGLSIEVTTDVQALAFAGLLRDLRIDRTPIDLGPPSSWQGPLPTDLGSASVTANGPGTFDFDASFLGTERQLLLRHASAPQAIPAIVTTRSIDGPATPTVSALSLAESTQRVRPVHTTAWAPGTGPRAAIVDLATIAANGWIDRPTVIESVYLATDDKTAIAGIRDRLTAAGLTVQEPRYAADRAQDYSRSASGWALRLSALVAALALAAAGAALAALLGATAGATRRELAAYRLLGLRRDNPRGVVRAEILPIVLTGTLIGAVCGVAAAAVTLHKLPLFLRAPVPDVTVRAPSILVAVSTAVGAGVVLAALAVLLARWVASASEPSTLAEGS